MNTVLFGVVFGIIMVFMMINFFSVKTVIPVVKAGKVTDPYHKEEKVGGGLPKVINVNGKRVDVSGFVVFYVHGNSMKKYKIKDKQRIFAKPLGKVEYILNHPVLVFRIVNHKPDDAEYKLRKYVNLLDSIEGVDWSEVYEANKERISIAKEEFIEQCSGKAERDRDFLTGKVVLSETFDEAEQKDCYSLHPLATAYATVEYAA